MRHRSYMKTQVLDCVVVMLMMLVIVTMMVVLMVTMVTMIVVETELVMATVLR